MTRVFNWWKEKRWGMEMELELELDGYPLLSFSKVTQFDH
jgi:hypothetical protein